MTFWYVYVANAAPNITFISSVCIVYAALSFSLFFFVVNKNAHLRCSTKRVGVTLYDEFYEICLLSFVYFTIL